MRVNPLTSEAPVLSGAKTATDLKNLLIDKTDNKNSRSLSLCLRTSFLSFFNFNNTPTKSIHTEFKDKPLEFHYIENDTVVVAILVTNLDEIGLNEHDESKLYDVCDHIFFTELHFNPYKKPIVVFSHDLKDMTYSYSGSTDWVYFSK